MRNRWLFGGLAALVVLVGVGVWAFWPEKPVDPPRQRDYKNASACLVTDDKGVTGPQAAPVWAAMQQFSLDSLIMVRYYEVIGAQTVDNAQTFIAGAQAGCDVVVAVGENQIKAAEKSAATFKEKTFVLVDGGSAGSSNIRTIPTGEVSKFLTEHFK